MAWDRLRTGRWLVISLAITAAGSGLLWLLLDTPVFLGFLFLPFLPLLIPGRPAPQRTCPACGHESDHPGDRFCPRDGTPLQ